MPFDFGELVSLHDKLSKRIKQYETATGRFPPTEVLNEIRYSYRAVIEKLTIINSEDPEDHKKISELYQRAMHALNCAYHDLIDGLVIELTQTLSQTQSLYPTSTREVLGKDKAKIIGTCVQAQNIIQESRGSPSGRKNVYDETLYDGLYEDLLDHKAQLDNGVIEDIVQHHHEREETEWKTNRRYKLMRL